MARIIKRGLFHVSSIVFLSYLLMGYAYGLDAYLTTKSLSIAIRIGATWPFLF